MKTHALLLPIAFVQGLWLWQRTPSLPIPDGKSGRFTGYGGRRLRVVGVGDSVMAGTGVKDQRHSLTASYARLLHEGLRCDVEWCVHGIKGATSATVLRQVAPAVPRADIYLVSCGVNDATRGVPPRDFVANLGGVLSLLRQKSPKAMLVYAGLPPLDSIPLFPWPLKSVLAARVEEMRTAAAELFAGFERVLSFRFPETMPADQFASDGFHPAESACEGWARGLLELWPQSPRPVTAEPAAVPVTCASGVAACAVNGSVLL